MYMQRAKIVKTQTQPNSRVIFIITSTKVSILENVPGRTKVKIVAHTIRPRKIRTLKSIFYLH